jgi:hypothetical protein
VPGHGKFIDDWILLVSFPVADGLGASARAAWWLFMPEVSAGGGFPAQ